MAECKDPKARIAVEIERAAKDALLDTSYDGWGPWEDSHNARGPLRLSRNASRIEMRCEQAVVLRARSERWRMSSRACQSRPIATAPKP